MNSPAITPKIASGPPALSPAKNGEMSEGAVTYLSMWRDLAPITFRISSSSTRIVLIAEIQVVEHDERDAGDGIVTFDQSPIPKKQEEYWSECNLRNAVDRCDEGLKHSTGSTETSRAEEPITVPMATPNKKPRKISQDVVLMFAQPALEERLSQN